MEDQGTFMAEETHADRTKQTSAVVFGDVELDLLRAIRRAFPWLQLTRALRMSFGPGKILLAIVGILLLEVAWSGLEWGTPVPGGTNRVSPIRRRLATNRAILPFAASDPIFQNISTTPLVEPAGVFLHPLKALVSGDPFTAAGLQASLRLLATIIVWGLFGAAISRIALVQAGRGGGLGVKGALRHAFAQIAPCVLTPLLPIVVLVLAALACSAFGLIFRLPEVGDFLGGLFLVVPLGLGLLMFAMVAGLLGSWPLMVVSAAAEGEDSLDALSRSFSYLNHRLGRYLFYLAAAWVIGILGLLFINWAVDGVLTMTRWGLAPVVPANLLQLRFPSPTDPSTVVPSLEGWVGAPWIRLVELIPRAWAYSYFWSSLSIIYLLIRKDVDGAEWSELRPGSVADEA
jgi:hypothetical protein